MTTSQKQNLLNEIEAFEKNDYKVLFVKNNSNTEHIDAIMAGDYQVLFLIEQSLKVVSILKKAIETDDWLSLPYTYSVPDYGQMTVKQAIATLRDCLISRSYDNAVRPLNFLINYEKSLNLWSPARNIAIGIRESTLSKLESRVEVLQLQTEEQLSSVKDLISNVDNQNHQIAEFFNNVREESEEINKNREIANTIIAEMKGLQENANNVYISMKNINEQSSETNLKINDVHENSIRIQNELEKKNEKIDDSIITLDKEIQREADTINKVYQETLVSKDKVKELMSYISDGTLAHSFNQRKKSVTKMSYIWLALGTFAAISLVVIICMLFATSKIDMQNLWADIVMKSLKTFPVACMVIYFFKEYSKERVLTEEYAFREAVAITLKAYMDQLNGEKDEYKRNLLLETVNKLYTKPTFTSKGDAIVDFKSKDLVELADKLVEGVKIIKK